MQRRRNPEVIAGRVNADGSIAAGDGFTVQKLGGSGAYTVTFAPGFRPVACTVSPATVGAFAAITNTTGNAVGISTSNTSNAATDFAFHFVAAGAQA